MAKHAQVTKGKGGKPEPTKAVQAVVIIPSINKGALSTDVGPRVIVGLAKAYNDEQQAKQLLAGVDAKRYDLLGETTMAIVKAAKADKSIDLNVSFGADKVGKNRLGDQLRLALGISEVVTVGKGDTAKKKIAYATAVKDYFPQPGENKDSEIYKRKNTLRTNFSHILTKCTQTAAGILERGIDAKMDKKAGTLMLSGPEIKKQFGASSVHLNEKQVVQNGKTAVELTAKPSFTAIQAKAAERHGKVLHRGSNTRGVSAQLGEKGLDGAVEAVCKSLVSIIAKLGDKISDKSKAALEGARSALDKVLD